MKITSLAAAAAALILPAVALGATLSFDRALNVGGIAVVNGSCSASNSGGHVVFDLVQASATIRLDTVGNIVASNGSFNSFIKIPDNAPSGAGTVRATCPDGTVLGEAVSFGPFIESVPLPGSTSVVPTGGVSAGFAPKDNSLFGLGLLAAALIGLFATYRKTDYAQ